jgi:hypothetical protein
VDRDYGVKQLREAEAETEAPRGKVATDAVARKVMRAKRDLKLLEAASPEKPKRRATRGGASGAASS